MTKLTEINQCFKVPIYYNKDKVAVNKTIIKDLELVESVDASCAPIYTYCFENDNDVSTILNEQLSAYYTTDVSFLKDNQQLLKEHEPLGVKYTDYSANYKNMVDIWNELKTDIHFKEKYCFVEWDVLEFLNRSDTFLQLISIYNLMSPVISLLIPIIILIVPFFIIKLKGLSITMTEYVDILKTVANENAIGKLFVVNFNEINGQEKTTIFVSAVFYLFSIYQNFHVCFRFNNNMKRIHNHFNEIRIYLDHTMRSMDAYLLRTRELVSHAEFNGILRENLAVLQRIHAKIKNSTDYNMFNFGKIKDIGYVFKCFYELHCDKIYDDAILYSLGFNGYIDCLTGLQKNLLSGKMNYCSFIDQTKKGVFEKSYYASLKNAHPVKNTIKLKKNMIITGPNASGKTTILKTTLINVLFSQQFGCGFYEYGRLKPYHHIHCYLNIPDTSGRDSLFQAEARRCKEILDSIGCHKQDTHFCGFDELYSGTNPEEAEQSATSFMKYISKYTNVHCMLTTHFTKICKRLATTQMVENYRMRTETNETQLVYKYLLEKGVSKVKGGLMVLTQMDYPKEIIEYAIR